MREMTDFKEPLPPCPLTPTEYICIVDSVKDILLLLLDEAAPLLARIHGTAAEKCYNSSRHVSKEDLSDVRTALIDVLWYVDKYLNRNINDWFDPAYNPKLETLDD